MADYFYPADATARTAGTLESSDMSFMGYDGSNLPLVTDYTDIRDAAMSNPGGAIGDGTAATGLNVTGDSDLDGAVVINDTGADKDTRIEGDTDTDLLVVDAGSDHVNVSLAADHTSLAKLNVGGAILLEVHTDDVTNPPTDAEIDAAIGTPAAAGTGYMAFLDDNGAGANFYLIASNGTNWWSFPGTKLT
jgi:hypothetical protein